MITLHIKKHEAEALEHLIELRMRNYLHGVPWRSLLGECDKRIRRKMGEDHYAEMVFEAHKLNVILNLLKEKLKTN